MEPGVSHRAMSAWRRGRELGCRPALTLQHGVQASWEGTRAGVENIPGSDS